MDITDHQTNNIWSNFFNLFKRIIESQNILRVKSSLCIIGLINKYYRNYL